MKRHIGWVLAAGLALGLGSAATADDGAAVIDKAIKAHGGADKLAAVKAVSWKAKGKISIGGNDSDFSSKTTLQDLHHLRQEFEADFGGNQIKGATILAGEKAWRKLGDDSQPLDGAALAGQKQSVYLQAIPALLLPLKGNGFKVESVSEDKVGAKPATVLKMKGPDGKDFELYFDKASGLLVKEVATVASPGGEGDFKQEVTFTNYKDVDGIKRATKVEFKRDGEKFIEQELTDFQVNGKLDPKTFAEP